MQRERSIAMIRLLSAMRLTTKRRRPPKPQQPDALRLEYFRDIEPVCEAAREEFDKVRPRIEAALRDLRARQDEEEDERNEFDPDPLVVPSSPPPPTKPPPSAAAAASERYSQDLINEAARKFAARFNPEAIKRMATRMGLRVEAFADGQFDRQVRAAVGVPASALPKSTTDLIPSFADANVALIKTVPERYFERLRVDVQRAYTTGEHVETFSRDLSARYGMQLDDARRIARDQVGKLNAAVNRDRFQAIGVTTYVWRTANDNRVREEHRHLEGRTFAYADPPPAGTNGEPANPGEAICCRCFAEPVLSPLLN